MSPETIDIIEISSDEDDDDDDDVPPVASELPLQQPSTPTSPNPNKRKADDTDANDASSAAAPPSDPPSKRTKLPLHPVQEQEQEQEQEQLRQSPTIELQIPVVAAAAAAAPQVSSTVCADDGEPFHSQSSGAARGDDEGEEVFKTAKEWPQRRRLVFGDNEDYNGDDEHFVAPEEASIGPLGLAEARRGGETGAQEDDNGGEKVEEREEVKEEVKEEENSDDDAPPEAVSTRVAHAQTKMAADAAAKVTEQQAADHKRRRQDRDALFKQQATEKRGGQQKDVTAAPRAQRAQLSQHLSEKPAVADPLLVPGDAETPGAHTWAMTTSTSKFLPAELLESDDEADGPVRPKKITFPEDDNDDDSRLRGRGGGGGGSGGGGAIGSIQAAQQQKRATMDAAERKRHKPARDERVGTSVYRVIKARDRVELAPSVAKASRNMKQDMQTRGRVAQRRQGAGFIVRG